LFKTSAITHHTASLLPFSGYVSQAPRDYVGIRDAVRMPDLPLATIDQVNLNAAT
jgi:hypothetical protein